ncbi:hypothetical protein [Streptomyces sodiiphilus]
MPERARGTGTDEYDWTPAMRTERRAHHVRLILVGTGTGSGHQRVG